MINKSRAIILIFSISSLLNAGLVFGSEDPCSNIKQSIHKINGQLFHLIDSVDNCSKPAESYRGKVFSNLKYRASRLKACIKMVQQGNFGFDCSRELKKTLRSQGGESCENELENMKKDFKQFLVLSLEYQTCLKR